jgi:general stress protein YciG
MKNDIKKYLSEIGRKGGKKSKRTLTRKQSLAMIKAREEGRANKMEPGVNRLTTA